MHQRGRVPVTDGTHAPGRRAQQEEAKRLVEAFGDLCDEFVARGGALWSQPVDLVDPNTADEVVPVILGFLRVELKWLSSEYRLWTDVDAGARKVDDEIAREQVLVVLRVDQ